MPATVGMNGNGPWTNDLIKGCVLMLGSYQTVCPPHLTATSGWRDATEVGLTGNGIPTQFPAGTEAMFIFLPQGGMPAWREGTYNVTFTPGLEWTFSGGTTTSTRTAYNSAAGTATVVLSGLSDLASGPRFDLTGYNGVNRTLPASASFFFRAFKQGADPAKLVAQEYKNALAPFAGGYIRMMTSFRTNRGAVTGLTYNTLNTFYDNNSLMWSDFSIPPVEALAEIAADCGMVPWVNVYDLASDSAVTAMAQRLKAAWPGSFVLEYSNEMWNFSGGFTQSTSLYNRAQAAGVSNYIQYSRELAAKIALFDAVYAGQTSKVRPIVNWQGVAPASQWAALLDEGNLYQRAYGVACSNYFKNLGDYTDTATVSKANRDLILTDPAAFKTAMFAAMNYEHDYGAFGISFLISFVNMVRDYCQSKGLARSALRAMHYEAGHTHTIEANTPTVNNQQTLTQQAFADMLRDPRTGALAVEHIRRSLDADVDFVYFDLATRVSASLMRFGIWSVMDTITDTTQEPYASVAAYLRAPTQNPRKHVRFGLTF